MYHAYSGTDSHTLIGRIFNSLGQGILSAAGLCLLVNLVNFVFGKYLIMASHRAAAVKSGILLGLGVTLYRAMEGRRPGQGLLEGVRGVYTPTVLEMAAVGTCLWGFRSVTAINALLVQRYADVTYQILRPDVLKNRVFALKYFGSGLLVVPILTLGLAWYLEVFSFKDRSHLLGNTLFEDRSDVARRLGLHGFQLDTSLNTASSSRDIRQFLSNLKADRAGSIWQT